MTLLQRVVVPVATEEDAAETCAALSPYVGEIEEVVAVHVIEKAGGGIDKAPLEKRQEDAEDILDVVEDALADDVSVERDTAYGTDVVETLLAEADRHDATAVAFVAREGSRLVRLLSGDTSIRLVTEATLPVVALPNE
jgi:nucleotide-binding universal stress UspA family protein